MLRGNALAKIDGKGRLKVPAAFRSTIEPQYGNQFFVTSLLGDSVRIYPLEVYAKLESLLSQNSKFGSRVHKLSTALNYYGQNQGMDAQGRILIHPLLRKKAGLDGEVTCLGQQNFLEVWDHKRFEERMEANPLTDDDLNALAELGF